MRCLRRVQKQTREAMSLPALRASTYMVGVNVNIVPGEVNVSCHREGEGVIISGVVSRST